MRWVGWSREERRGEEREGRGREERGADGRRGKGTVREGSKSLQILCECIHILSVSAPMHLSSRGDRVDELHACIGRVVLPLSLLSIVMTYVICIPVYIKVDKDGDEQSRGYDFSKTSGPTPRENSDFQKRRAFSTLRPMPLR